MITARHFRLLPFLISIGVSVATTSIYGQANEVDEILSNQHVLSFDDYVNSGGFIEWEQLENDRIKWNDKNESGDNLVFQIAEEFIARYPIKLKGESIFDHYLDNADEVRKVNEKVADSIWVYDALIDMLLSPLADKVQYLVNETGRSAKRPPIATWIERLGDHKYHIDLPVSNWRKTIKHLKRGDFKYLWHKATTTYQKEAFMLMGMFILLFVLLIIGIRRWLKNRKNDQ